ncbi:MAG: hypothetical protein QM610_07245 [Chitinophagaceae bacterium]
MTNNISILLHDFLLENKEISLEKIGHLHLKPSTVTTEDGQTFPEVEFVYGKTAVTSPGFIDFLAEREHKSRVIVQSDVDYFLEENRQLMNIGTSVLSIPGLGYLHSLQTGGYGFSQQPTTGFRDGEIRKKVLTDDIYDRTLDAGTDQRPPINYKKTSSKSMQANVLGFVIILLVLGGIGFGIYYFLNQTSIKPEEQTLANTADTGNAIVDKPTTAETVPDKSNRNVAGDQDFYKFVFEITKDAERAHLRIAKLKAYGDKVAYDSVNTTEGLYFRLYAPISKTADTTKAKDSLFRYFQKPIQIAKHN